MHKLTTYLAKNHNPPPSPPGRGARGVGEDLNVSGMIANHRLAKAVTDMGFYEFRRQLEYKCELYGSELIIVDRWFPSSKTCSRCGTVKKSLFLLERVIKLQCSQFQLRLLRNASANEI
ncbi:zinc ribbon domain-containing protein [Okeania sp. SIO2C2]|uniref:zinc ribbon domain-containing protein n=1 Tax=Okeania sp. SIO2C2 TaxID=2607787 RepID=UPI00257A1E10|nr:zinc ribbon domain-containing protein [Okeania sp. SIO2C2]